MYKLKPLLKWRGGKSSELEIIKKFMPKEYDNYYEPFIGGGAVWLSINNKKMFINDLSEDLIKLYNNVKNENNDMYFFLDNFVELWLSLNDFIKENSILLTDLFINLRDSRVNPSIKISNLINNSNIFKFYYKDNDLKSIIIKSVNDKYKRMLLNETKLGTLKYEEYINNIETGFRSGLYLFLRDIYNKDRTGKEKITSGIQSGVYFILRDICYSGMFRFNKNNEFNVPYGGASYNKKDFKNKVSYIKNELVIHHLKSTIINNGDFYDFMKKSKPLKKDFIFLDPPYDTEFSDYDGNDFTLNDQDRLANYLINECNSKWMMVIKYTDYIFNLYNNDSLNIIMFDKDYSVSIMNRNDKSVKHLLIRNYQ